ncbi:MAG: HlyC/CorC family transporter [Lysobacterales bacterium]|nr:MAG: HlyC/CorC family transporter [Xanthomonadales bacterium]
MDITLILILIALNAVFALSEMAVIASRDARLQHLAEEGHAGASTASALHRDPSRFLSTIQIGITAVGVVAGAVGESAIAEPLSAWLERSPALAPYAWPIAFALTIVGITYFSVVLGELVPKRLALLAPERIAMLVAVPMNFFSRLAAPFVWLLSKSSDAVIALVPKRPARPPPVTDEEISVLMEQGTAAGVFHESEQAYVSNVLRLDERRVTSIMTPRPDFYVLDLDDDEPAIRECLARSPHTRLVACRGGTDNILGIVDAKDLLADLLEGRPLDVASRVKDPLRVPETATTTMLIETFRAEGRQLALVMDEYGEVQGLVTDSDFLGAIVGDIGEPGTPATPGIVARDDGSWLVEGGLPMVDVQDALDLGELPGEGERDYSTVAGFVLHQLGRIPQPADHFDWDGWRFEVIDMDGRRVDKVLVSRPPP